MNKSYGLGDANLKRLWRLAVKKKYGRCVICGNLNQDQLECHHIVHVRCKLLKYDMRNGVPVCKPLIKDCHAYCDTIAGHEIIKRLIGENAYQYIKENERVIHKDFLRENNLSDADWKIQVKKKLEAFINE